jgi:hypothetical protein
MDEIIDDIITKSPQVELCIEHNQPYTKICCNNLYCDECRDTCEKCSLDEYCDIDDWKKQTLIDMQNLEDKLNNKVKGLNCIMEIITNTNNNKEITKQIEDIIDTIYVDISHIYNFNKFINDDIPISNVIKRKKQILKNKRIIQIPSVSLDEHLNCFINMIIKNDGDIHANYEEILIWAMRYDKLSIVESLIKYGADVHTLNDRALRWASKYGHLNVVKCLIAHGAVRATP